MEASRSLSGPQAVKFSGDKAAFLEDIRKVKHINPQTYHQSTVPGQINCDVKGCVRLCPQALYASKIISYAQGFMLLRQAAKEFSWSLNYGAIALMWRGGCIIRRYASTPPDPCSIFPHVNTHLSPAV